MGIADLQERLGFKYTSSVWFKALDTLPRQLREFRASIDELVTESEHLTQAKAKESQLLRRRCNEALVRLGPVLWPDGARLRHDCPQWLTFAPDSSYGTDLFWNKREHQTKYRTLVLYRKLCKVDLAQDPWEFLQAGRAENQNRSDSQKENRSRNCYSRSAIYTHCLCVEHGHQHAHVS